MKQYQYKIDKTKYTKTIGHIPYHNQSKSIYNNNLTSNSNSSLSAIYSNSKNSLRSSYAICNNCNNCGKSGHVFHQCKMPIMSIGIILFRIVPQNKYSIEQNDNKEYDIKKSTQYIIPSSPILPPPGLDISLIPVSHKTSPKGDINIEKQSLCIEYLIIRRKETLGYIDFMRGKYSIQNKDYIMNMLKQMTNKEKQQLKCKDFDLLWKNIWGTSANNNQYKSEEINSREKYYTLINGVKLYNDYYNLDDLIDGSSAYQSWEEPEWGFPKGRRNNQENDFDCAIREFSEETGYSSDKLVYLQNVLPYEEIFTGSNYKSYKHKYFLMYMNYEDTLNIGQYQTSEVSMIAWKTLDECIKIFRPYNLEKIRILKKVDCGLKKQLSDTGI